MALAPKKVAGTHVTLDEKLYGWGRHAESNQHVTSKYILYMKCHILNHHYRNMYILEFCDSGKVCTRPVKTEIEEKNPGK